MEHIGDKQVRENWQSNQLRSERTETLPDYLKLMSAKHVLSNDITRRNLDAEIGRVQNGHPASTNVGDAGCRHGDSVVYLLRKPETGVRHVDGPKTKTSTSSVKNSLQSSENGSVEERREPRQGSLPGSRHGGESTKNQQQRRQQSSDSSSELKLHFKDVTVEVEMSRLKNICIKDSRISTATTFDADVQPAAACDSKSAKSVSCQTERKVYAVRQNQQTTIYRQETNSTQQFSDDNSTQTNAVSVQTEQQPMRPVAVRTADAKPAGCRSAQTDATPRVIASIDVSDNEPEVTGTVVGAGRGKSDAGDEPTATGVTIRTMERPPDDGEITVHQDVNRSGDGVSEPAVSKFNQLELEVENISKTAHMSSIMMAD
jgi:hypothetical protein